MEHVFIDTSIFIKENYLEGGRIRQLLKLSEQKIIRIVLPRITVNEVKNRFKKSVVSNQETISKIQPLRNIDSSAKLLQALLKIDAVAEFNKLFDDALVNANVLILEYKKVDLTELFENYFEEKPPFNSSKKKNEFPDALTILSLSNWCKEQKKKIKVFSTDKDFENYKSEILLSGESYENYLNEILASQKLVAKRKMRLANLFEINSDKIDNEIKDWYKKKLDDTGLYNAFIYAEIHDIGEIQVNVLEKNYRIMYADDESIQIEITAEISYQVPIEVDDENDSYYDSEEKETIYFSTVSETIERIDIAKVDALAYIIDETDFDRDIEIQSINKGRTLKVEPETNRWF